MNTAERTPGYYDNAGPAVMDAWLRAMLQHAGRRDAGRVLQVVQRHRLSHHGRAVHGLDQPDRGREGLFNALAGPDAGVPQGYDFFNGQRPETVTLAALDDALAALKQAYGPDQAAWKVPAGPMVFAPKNFLGVPQADAKATLTIRSRRTGAPRTT